MASGKLTARAAATTKPGSYGDGAGLWLVVAPSSARKWVYRFTWQGKVTQMGLGSADVVSLAQARDLRDEARKTLAGGVNPIEARRAAGQGGNEKVTFGQVADEYFEAKKGEYRNEKYREMVRLALTRTAAPLRPLPVDEIDTEAVLAALKPVWVATPETGKRLREKIEAVLDAATAKGLRHGENPARWKAHLEHLLPKRNKAEKAHHAAMDYGDLPGFVEKLRGADTTAALALEFCILTAARSGEVYGARWPEIDRKAKVWTIPAQRMKAARVHRVPLPARALEILEQLAKARTGEFVFPTPRGGNRPLSHVAMAKVMDRLGVTGATVHGFRSSFRDWAGHETSFPREIAEQALAHRLGDAAELAYKRGDFLEKRRVLMTAWANFIEAGEMSNVLLIPSVPNEMPEAALARDDLEDEDTWVPAYDDLVTLASLLRKANPRKRKRGAKGKALDELAEIEARIEQGSLSPGERSRLYERLWTLNGQAHEEDRGPLGVGQFSWRKNGRPKGAPSSAVNEGLDDQMIMRAEALLSGKGSIGAALRAAVEEARDAGRLPTVEIESQIKRLRRKAQRQRIL